MVEDNFDRFIAIKAATFNVYEEMKLGPLGAEEDYSVADLRESLKRAPSLLSLLILAALTGNVHLQSPKAKWTISGTLSWKPD